MLDNSVALGESTRSWSLRREWSRAFMIMLVLLLAAAAASIVGVHVVVHDVRGPASALDRQSVAVSSLRTDIVAHEEDAHRLLSNKPVDRAQFVRQQTRISAEFVNTAAVFPRESPMRDTVIKAQESWQRGLTEYGLWGTEIDSLQGDHSADNPEYGASSDATGALLDGLEGPSLAAMNAGLAHGDTLELTLILSLAGLFALALGVTIYFRRRMTKDLVRPIAEMHNGVRNLQSGDYDHRIAVARRDELGELAGAFNGMAAALRDTHQALTIRATHDSLTGLANRASLVDRLTASFAPGLARRAHGESLLFIDVDEFKDVNDSVGHAGGDSLLIELAGRLSNCVRPYDMVARLGGDEFAIVVLEDGTGSTAIEIAERILEAMGVPFAVGEDRLCVTVSIGVAPRRPDTADAAELLRQADFAMYMAKGGGKHQLRLFDAQMQEQMRLPEAISPVPRAR